jgi:hypothetical protein
MAFISGVSMNSGRVWATAVVAALGCFCLSINASARSFGLSREKLAVSVWQVGIRPDPFSGERRCRLALQNGKAVYAEHAILFSLGRRFDVSEATIRIDNGAAMRWRDLISELAPSMGDPLNYGASQHIPVPAHLVEGAERIAIQSAFGKKPRVYVVEGFDTARQGAIEVGCRPDAAFTRK